MTFKDKVMCSWENRNRDPPKAALISLSLANVFGMSNEGMNESVELIHARYCDWCPRIGQSKDYK